MSDQVLEDKRKNDVSNVDVLKDYILDQKHHAAVMEDIRELAVDFKRLASAFKIPPDKMKALEYKHRNALDVWDALCDVVLEWLKWNCDLTTESGNPNRRWLVNAVKSINNELGIRLEEKYINDPC